MSSRRSFSVGFMPIALIAQPNSFVLMLPPPSTSNSLNACNKIIFKPILYFGGIVQPFLWIAVICREICPSVCNFFASVFVFKCRLKQHISSCSVCYRTCNLAAHRISGQSPQFWWVNSKSPVMRPFPYFPYCRLENSAPPGQIFPHRDVFPASSIFSVDKFASHMIVLFIFVKRLNLHRTGSFFYICKKINLHRTGSFFLYL